MSEPHILKREDIFGRKIASIRQKLTINDRGLDYAYSFFVLDSGVSFCLPFDDAGEFWAEAAPEDAEPLDDSQLSDIFGKEIVDVLREGPDSDIYHESPYLLLSNGYLITDVLGEYHGVNGVGVFIYRPEEVSVKRLVPFFDENK